MNKFVATISFVFLTLTITSNANALVVGNEVIDRGTLDGAQDINFIDTTLSFTTDGRVESWDIFAGRDGEFALQVFRSTGTSNEYSLIGENFFTSTALGAQRFIIPLIDQILVQTGDIVGWWFGGNGGIIDFDYTSDSNDVVQWQSEVFNAGAAHINVGDPVTFIDSRSGSREYSISANYSEINVPEPPILTLLALGFMCIGARKST